MPRTKNPTTTTALAKPSLDLDQRVALRRAEAAVAAGVSITTIDAAIASGRLQARWLGNRILVPVDALRAWIDSLPMEGGRAA